MTISFYLHQSKTEGFATVYHRISVDGKRADLNSTGIKIIFDHWDSSLKTISKKDPEHFWKNDKISTIRNKLNSIYAEFFRNNRNVSAELIKSIYQGNTSSMAYMEVFELFKKEAAKRVEADRNEKIKRKRRIAPGTPRQYETHRRKILDYLIMQKCPRIAVDEFDEYMLEGLMSWMSDDLKHEDAYTYKVAVTARAITAFAKRKKIITQDPLISVKLVQPPTKKPVALTIQQFENLRDVPFKNERLQRVADVFVVYCRTGFHYIDLKIMAKNSKDKLRKGIDGNEWIYHNRAKTILPAKVPVFEEVQHIVDKYGGWDKLPILSDQKLNDYLKLIAIERNLPPKLSVKVGRSTFADWLLNDLGWPEDAVKVVLGLIGRDTLKHYAKSDERKVAKEMARYNSENQ